MIPVPLMNHVIDESVSHPKLFRKREHWEPSLSRLSYLPNHLFRQFCGLESLPLALATLRLSVVHVVPMAPKEEVIGVAAGRVVARMEYEPFTGINAIGQLIHHAMASPHATVSMAMHREQAVPPFVPSARPWPALVWFGSGVHFGPESFEFFRSKISIWHHDLHVVWCPRGGPRTRSSILHHRLRAANTSKDM